MSIPSAGPPTLHSVIGVTGVGETKHAPTSVPPDRLMTGQAAAADLVREPAVGLGVPRLAGRGEDPERREVVRPHGFDAVGDQRADQRGRDAQRGHAVAFHRGPQPVRPGVRGRAFGEQHRRTQGERADDLPRPHDPAEVGDPMQHLARDAGPPDRRPPRRSSPRTRRGRGRHPSAGPSSRWCSR